MKKKNAIWKAEKEVLLIHRINAVLSVNTDLFWLIFDCLLAFLLERTAIEEKNTSLRNSALFVLMMSVLFKYIYLLLYLLLLFLLVFFCVAVVFCFVLCLFFIEYILTVNGLNPGVTCNSVV